jgi:energy-converting hydrogenase Eha subunit C
MIPYYIDVKYTLIRKYNNTLVTLSVIYKQSRSMPGAFGEDHHVGNYMLNNQNACISFSLDHSAQKRNDMMNPYKTLTQASVDIQSIQSTSNQRREVGMSQTMRTSGIFDTLGNILTPRDVKIMKRLELVSSVLSFLCLLGSIGIIAQKYPLNISLTRNVDLISRDRVAMDYMKLWHYAADMSCGNNKDFEVQLLTAPWRSDTKKQFDGLVVEASVKVSEIELCFIAFSIYVFSTSFQFLRWWCFESFCDPENGPEFSRWLEYAFTSPLQVLIVALAFRITNIDVLLGYFGMQLALVIMGYDIERQIEKKYKRSTGPPKDGKKRRFYNILQGVGIHDIRGWVYLLLSWTLHLLIWGIPGLWHADFIRWGISGDYAYVRRYLKACFTDVEFQMPDAIDFIFWSQYTLFTVFGIVCSVQFLLAYVRPVKDENERKQRWRTASMWYSILSVSAKTILEVGFLMLLVNGQQWLEFERVPKDLVVTRYPNVTNVTRLSGNATTQERVPGGATCFSMAPGAR